MKKLPIIIDTDPGIDDAAALIIALTHPAFDVRLLTTVMGNVNIDKTTLNALRLVEFLDVDVPVAKGAGQPLLREYEDASYAHGETGMDGYDFPEVSREPVDQFAVEAMRDELLSSEEPITLVTIGALTNLALLITQYPECLSKIKEVVMMGGSLSHGNTTSAAEYNIYADPHAAQMVFQSGLPLTMIGLDVTVNTLLQEQVTYAIKEANPAGHMLYSIFNEYRGGTIETGLRIHDACTIYYLIHKDKTETKDYFIEVQTEGPAMGATVADIRYAYHEGKTNCTVGLNFDVEHFNQWFQESIERIDWL